MANANAIVDKLATVGLRHGEKAGVAIAMMVFLVCVGIAVSQPTINTSPEQVKKAAQIADTNLGRTDDRETILKRLEEKDSIKSTNFAQTVEAAINVKVDPVVYKPKRDWVTPEPGAGLIRDQPELIAPSELFAYPGRGGLLVFELDDEGNRIPDTSEGKSDEPKQQRFGNTRSRRSSGGGMGGGMGGMMGGGQRKKKSKSKQEIAREAEDDRKREERRLKGALAGDISEAKAEKAESEADKEEGGPFKQTTKGYRWVAITGILDHAQMLANYRKALKNPSLAQPNYARLDLERRTLQEDGTWSDWEKVDTDKNFNVLDNLPAVEEELAPKTVLPDNLVDPLPFLNAGLWEKVHIASLVPKEKVKLPDAPKAQQGMPGMMGGGGMQGMTSMMQQQQGMMQSQMQGQMQNQSSMMSMMSRGGMGGMGGSSEAAGNFWKSEESRVMIRALDFTAERGSTYRYRVRIVVWNPNLSHDDAAHGVDTKSKTLPGPWSKETDVVVMPPDIEPYAVTALPASAQSDTKVRFEVVSFNPTDGWTVPHRFEAGVGEVIGDSRTVQVPRSDGTGAKREPIDFRTHQIVIDVERGGLQNLPTGIVGPPVDRPALAAVLRPDGSMAIHSVVDDLADEFRKDIEANYDHEIKESTKKRKNSRGSGMMGGMMGGGMMGGGMMGGGMMGGGRR